jgi:hypothetical protein
MVRPFLTCANDVRQTCAKRAPRLPRDATCANGEIPLKGYLSSPLTHVAYSSLGRHSKIL